MTSLTPEAASSATGRMPGLWLLVSTLIVAVVLYAGLFISASHVFDLFFCALYFWMDVGLFTGIAVLVIVYLVSRRILRKRRHRLQFAIQSSAIAFAIVGIALMAMVPRVGYYKMHMGGYRLHTQIWLDANRVRAWANRLDLSQDSAMSPARWPLTLMIMVGLTERVYVDEETRDVTIEHGSALCGHWGVHIAARGKDWAGESSGHGGIGDTKETLEDGVWIWSTMN